MAKFVEIDNGYINMDNVDLIKMNILYEKMHEVEIHFSSGGIVKERLDEKYLQVYLDSLIE